MLLSRACLLCRRFRERLGVKVVKALKRSHSGVVHAAVDMLCALMCVSKTGPTTAEHPHCLVA